jgi:hypothetical protein
MPSQQTAATVGLGTSVAGAGVAGAFELGLLSNPVTALAGAGLAIVNLIFGLGAHHDQAVKTEAAALNDIIAREKQAFLQIFSAANSGQVSAADASAAIDASVNSFDSVVYQQYGVKQKSGNGADVIKQVVQKWAASAKKLLSSGTPASYTTDFLPAHAGFEGAPSFTLTYSGPAAAASSVSPFNFSNSSQAGGGVSAPGVISQVTADLAGGNSKLFTVGAAIVIGLLLWRVL